MFHADGLGIRRNGDGTVTGKVRVYRDDAKPSTPMFEQSFTGQDMADIQAQVDAVLAKLKAAEDDVALNTAFVGVTISSL